MTNKKKNKSYLEIFRQLVSTYVSHVFDHFYLDQSEQQKMNVLPTSSRFICRFLVVLITFASPNAMILFLQQKSIKQLPAYVNSSV